MIQKIIELLDYLAQFSIKPFQIKIELPFCTYGRLLMELRNLGRFKDDYQNDPAEEYSEVLIHGIDGTAVVTHPKMDDGL